MKPHFFEKAGDFYNWFKKNHDKEKELLVGFYKVGTGKPSMSWSESVDQALCFGWIDGVRKSIDESSYTIRFTPRKPSSIWSAVNIAKVTELKKQGLMQPAGLAAFEKRKDGKSNLYSYENKQKQLDKEYEQIFKANKAAWLFFTSQAPSYQKTITYWVMSAKQEQTKMKRLEKLIQGSANGKRLI